MNNLPHAPIPRLVVGTLGSVVALVLVSVAPGQGLHPPPAPFENPVTASKAVVGKILFWDEQLSSDNTMACGSCHRPGTGGADPRVGRNPGFDGVLQTADDVLGSPGIVNSAPNGDFLPHGTFGLGVQATGRVAPTFVGAGYFSILRWDGIATETFIEPQTNQLRIMFGGALESHAAGPPTSDAEMAYHGRNWADIAAKLPGVRPLALATQQPPDVAAELASDPDYGELMRRAFGDRTIDATRIIYAIATYERTLVPNRTPWDDYVNGNSTALSPDQIAGLNLFEGAAGCVRCHSTPLFSDGSFRNLGLRPTWEDTGWQHATLDPNDRGKFKVPTLRNAGLRNRYMHNGRFASIAEVVDMYDQGGGPFTDNQDRLLAPLGLSAAQKAKLVDFVTNGLTDPRVAAEQTPFDRPVLHSERAPTSFGASLPGTGGIAPRTIHSAPLLVGNADFRIGIADGLGGATAALAFAFAMGPPGQSIGPLPVHLALTPPPLLVTLALGGSGAGDGFATLRMPIPPLPALIGADLYHQAFVLDPTASGGLSASAGAGGRLF